MYQATLHHNRRDIHTLSPKVLLTNIISDDGLFRDHCWVNESDVESFVPSTTNYKVTIQFDADTYNYHTREPNQVGLRNLRSVTKIPFKEYQCKLQTIS